MTYNVFGGTLNLAQLQHCKERFNSVSIARWDFSSAADEEHVEWRPGVNFWVDGNASQIF